jgi:hypothetical protein
MLEYARLGRTQFIYSIVKPILTCLALFSERAINIVILVIV